MKFICNDCKTKTPVKSIQINRNLCRGCCEYKIGYTIPECPNCDYEIDMIKTDKHLFICPKCGLCRSSKKDHLTYKDNPGTICPILSENKNISELERSHWHYEENDGHEESFIRISRDAHTNLHDGSRLLLQERDMEMKGNGIEIVLENLMKLDLQRISTHHKYHPYNVGILHLDYVLTRYAFPDYIDSTVFADIWGYDHSGIIPEDLKSTRKLFSKERKKYF